jgi:hypothetical protein
MVVLFSLSGHGDVNADGSIVIISNLDDGLDLYKIQNFVLTRRMTRKVVVNRPQQVSFGLSGDAVVTGSDQGALLIYDIHTGHLLTGLKHPAPENGHYFCFSCCVLIGD